MKHLSSSSASSVVLESLLSPSLPLENSRVFPVTITSSDEKPANLALAGGIHVDGVRGVECAVLAFAATVLDDLKEAAALKAGAAAAAAAAEASARDASVAATKAGNIVVKVPPTVAAASPSSPPSSTLAFIDSIGAGTRSVLNATTVAMSIAAKRAGEGASVAADATGTAAGAVSGAVGESLVGGWWIVSGGVREGGKYLRTLSLPQGLFARRERVKVPICVVHTDDLEAFAWLEALLGVRGFRVKLVDVGEGGGGGGRGRERGGGEEEVALEIICCSNDTLSLASLASLKQGGGEGGGGGSSLLILRDEGAVSVARTIAPSSLSSMEIISQAAVNEGLFGYVRGLVAQGYGKEEVEERVEEVLDLDEVLARRQ